jgi:hypothetical protein
MGFFDLVGCACGWDSIGGFEVALWRRVSELPVVMSLFLKYYMCADPS